MQGNPGKIPGRSDGVTGTMTLIMIIEDNETIADSIAYFIKYLAHYDTLIASSGELALDTLLKGVRPDLILLDVKLPGMSGIDFITRLRHDPWLKNIGIVIYSGLPAEKVRKDFEEKNIFISNILEKPITPSHLIQIIDETVKHQPVSGCR